MHTRMQRTFGTRRSLAAIVTTVVALWSLMLLVRLLAIHHTTGFETAGVIVAASGLGIGVLSHAFLAAPRRNRVARTVLLLLWLGLAFGGISGYFDHGRLPAPGHAPFADPRPRPPLAPLIFRARHRRPGGPTRRLERGSGRVVRSDPANLSGPAQC